MALGAGVAGLTLAGEPARAARDRLAEGRAEALGAARAAAAVLARGGQVTDPRVAVSDAGAGLNPNWLPEALLAQTTLKDGLLPGRSPAAWAQDRLDAGFSTDPDFRWGGWFRLDVTGAMTVWSPFPVNLADETVLERALALRTGDPAGAARFRTQLRAFRRDLRPVTEADWPLLAPGHEGLAAGLFTTKAPWNVNTVAPALLEALLSYPPLGLTQPGALAARIVEARTRGPLDADALRRLAGLGPGHPLERLLGTETLVWSLRVTAGPVEADTWWRPGKTWTPLGVRWIEGAP